MKNLPIRLKTLAVLGMYGAFTITAVGVVTHQMYIIGVNADRVNNTVVLAASDLSQASGEMEKIRAAMEYILLSNSASGAAAAGSAITASQHIIETQLKAAAAALPGEGAALQDLQNGTDALLDSPECKEVEALGQSWSNSSSSSNLQDFIVACAPGFVPLTHNIDAERDVLSSLAAQQLHRLKSQIDNTVFYTFTGVLGGFICMALLGYFGIGFWVVRPLDVLRIAMKRLAQGDFHITLDSNRHDELGAMARSVQVFLDAAKEKENLERIAAATAELVETERERNEQAREAAAASQAVVVEGIAAGLESLSEGNLMYRINVSFVPEYEKLRTDFNQAMETLQRTMQGIAANTHGVRSGASEINRSSDDLSRRTERQAASLEETAAALDEINATVGKTAGGANEARDVVNAAKADAERSGDVVRDTVTAMQQIEVSSKQISSIIGVIDEIAFQTNLLALNAGVEAARAGDAGRGFAVVATEVRALAQRSADAAKEIKALISASGTQVEAGVRLVGETGKALSRIVSQVGKLSELVGEIASSAQEQAVGLGQVNAAVNQMDQVTQQNAAMVQQATAASHALAEEAEELSRLVSQFRIGEAEAAPAPRLITPPAQQVRAIAPAPAGKFVALAAASTMAGNWDEF